MLLAAWRRSMATLLVFSLIALATVGPIAADSGAVFSGKVYEGSAANPEAGVVVTLVEPATERSYSSQPSADDGTFRIEDAPAGSYRVVAETPRGAFLAPGAVDLASGSNRPVALTLGQADPFYQTSQTAGGQQGQGGLPTWAKWVIVGGIAVLALLAIDSLTNDDTTEPPISPFDPETAFSE